MKKAPREVTERNREKPKLSFGIKFLIAIIVIIVILNVLFLILYFSGSSIGQIYDDLTLKLVCKNQEYNALEYYYENVPSQQQESYQEVVSGANCDQTSGCSCLHKSWFGLGACDSCKCTKYRTITVFNSEKKSRTVVKFANVCLKIRFWKSVNYNEDWLSYSEIYDSYGNRVNSENLKNK